MQNDIDFTRKGYQITLEKALNSGYQFLAFDDPQKFNIDKVCLLRHDIDADLGAALEIAKIEANLGIRSTYFLMLRSPIYNLFGRANHRIVQDIIALGHWIGLHYDEGFYPDNRYSLHEWIDIEAEVINNLFDVNIAVVSFHQPSQKVLSGEIKLQNFINTYNRDDLLEFNYISDSNKIWKINSPYVIFDKQLYEKIHLLIHPIWWCGNHENFSTEKLWENAITSNWIRSQKQLLETERAYGNERNFIIQYKNKKTSK